MTLKPDATVRDVVGTLSNPERWFSELLKELASILRNIDPNARVRIGVGGNGSSPNFMITYKDRAGTTVHHCRDGVYHELGGVSQGQGVDWQVHPEGSGWSSASSSLKDVQEAFHLALEGASRKAR